MKRTSWLCGVAAAVLLAGAGLSAGVHAQPVPRPAAQNPKLNLTFTDATGLFTMKSSDLRSKDPLYQKMEQYYVEGRISENDVKSIMQQRVNSIGKLVSSVQNETGRLSQAQIYQMVDGMVSSGGKFSDIMDQANATSSQMADAMGDLIPPTLKLDKDLSNLVMPAVETYISDIGSISMRYNEVIQGGDFSDAEKNNVNKEMNAIQSYVRLNAPSQMGTNARQLDDAITYYNDPAKLAKTKQAIDKFISDGGGPDKVREYWDAVKKGDAAKAKAIVDQMAQVARNKIRAQEQTRMTTYYGDPITPPTTTTDTTPSPEPIPATGPEPEPEQQPGPAPVPPAPKPKPPTHYGQQNADGGYSNAVNPNELRVPQAQQDALAAYERQQAQAAARQAGADAGAQAGQTLAAAASAAFPDPGLDPVILTPVDPDTGLRETRVDQRNHGGASPGGGSGEGSGDGDLLAYDSPFTLEDRPDTTPVPAGTSTSDASDASGSHSGFVLSDEQSAQAARDLAAADAAGTSRHHDFTVEDLGPEAATTEPRAPAYAPPAQPVYHEPEGGFTAGGMNGWWEMPDGQTVAANSDGSLPDGALAAHGRPRVAMADDGEDADNDFDPDRLSDNQTRSARDGNFGDSDAFDAAMAALSNSIDDNIRSIEAASDSVLDAWDRYADQVWYDEDGTLHRVDTPRPDNDYQPAQQDTRSATQIDRAIGQNDPWHDFDPSDIGEGVEVADLEAIYAGYDIDNAPQGSSMRSLSSAGTSLSSAGTSLGFDLQLPGFGPSTAQLALDRANGLLIDAADEWHTPTDWPSDDIGDHSIRVSTGGRSTDPALASLNDLRDQGGYDALYGALHGDNLWQDQPLAETGHDLAEALYGPLWSDRPYRIQSNAAGQWGGFTGGIDVASLSGLSPSQLRALTANDVSGGLTRLLAQPFNVLLTWGAGAYDLDLHMTGPIAEGDADRFHIYFSAKGALDGTPYAQLIKDCICNSGSEVILTSALVQGQVYRISVFDYGDQDAASTNLSQASDAVLQIVRGGTAVSVGNGTTIEGGHVIYTGSPTTGGAGNTWLAVEIDPKTGKIRAPDTILQSPGSDNVH